MLSVVVTSIAAPNAVLRSLADGCLERGHSFYVIGDVPSPPDFHLEGCRFYGLADQKQMPFRSAQLVPERHYARKNLGYLQAIADGASLIVETDDDNFPRGDFWAARERRQTAPTVQGSGWVNAYRYFTDVNIWPRGLPLDAVLSPAPEPSAASEADCPIQQGLADENPDVDAVYRLVLPLPISFRQDVRLILGRGAWCPFNSQNTSWWPDAFPLLYLPAYCSFRMTDIWRSFVSQRIAWENGWSLLFHEPTVWQERNVHNLMRDFRDEIPGYLHNRAIAQTLDGLSLRSGLDAIPDNLRRCYEALVSMTVVGKEELPLLDAWLHDLQELTKGD